MESKKAVFALAALAQETRLAIYRLLVEAGPTGVSAGEIASAVKVLPATLSFHLKELAQAGLVEARQAGRYVFYAASFRNMNELLDYLSENCCARDGVACRPAAVCHPSRKGAAGRRRPPVKA